MSGVPLRSVWNGTPTKGGDLFTLRKDKDGRSHFAVCELWSSIFGWEVRLLINSELHQSRICRSVHEWADTMDEWKAALIEKGWL